MKKVVIAGGTGYLGQVLVRYFNSVDYECVILTRQRQYSHEKVRFVQWDAKSLGNWIEELENAGTLINLTGRSVNCRYNAQNRLDIFNSRQLSTLVLGEAILQCKNPPKVWLNSASATIYRHAQDRAMDEFGGEMGEGFSVEVCKLWEHTFNGFNLPKTRKIILRSALVLGNGGGVFPEFKKLVQMGLGGKMGSGAQMVSWIHEQDFAKAVHFLIENPRCSGIFNLSAPSPLSNSTMMSSLRRQMNIRFGLPSTLWMLKLGTWLKRTEPELVLKSRWVIPTKLKSLGFGFEFNEFEKAVDNLLKI
ncbi:MAG: TIGR01777 family oxidoreductase [Spirosomataceae bacterium]